MTGPSLRAPALECIRRQVALVFLLALVLPAVAACSRGPTADAEMTARSELSRVDHAEMLRVSRDGGAVILDARLPLQYELGHIPNARNLPFDHEDLTQPIERWSLSESRVLVYCNGPGCDAAEILAERLREAGCRDVALYPGGWEEWSSSRGD